MRDLRNLSSLYQDQHLSKFIFVDEPALVAGDPDSPTGVMSHEELAALQENMANDTDATIETFNWSLLHKKENNIDYLVKDAQQENGQFLLQLIYHHVLDWSDVLPCQVLRCLH